VLSDALPEHLRMEPGFDVIFVSSLFSHLPERTFGCWLETLLSLLGPRGVLVFSTLGIEYGGQPEAEFVFRRESESRTLAAEDYGTTFVSERFTTRCLHAIAPRAPVRFLPHGHLGFQDLYVVSRDPDVDLGSLPYEIGCFGHAAHGWRGRDGVFHLRGWAADLGGAGRCVTIRVLLEGRCVHECAPDYDRPEVAQRFGTPRALRSGWSCAVPSVSEDDWVTVQLVDRSGRAQTISLARARSMTQW
jgi:SAM-dependent methyltransferase